MSARAPIIVIGAGIVGVSASIWLQRAGLSVVLVDREGPAAGASQGNAGVLAAGSVVPVTTPGLIAKAPGMLFNKQQPLYLRWGYLPRLTPWLIKYLRHCNPEQVDRIASALGPITADTLVEHRSLAKGTGAEQWIEPGEYVYAYDSKAHFEADRFAWDMRRAHGFEWVEQDRATYAANEPAFGDRIGYVARIGNHGRILDPGQYVRDLANHAFENGATFVKGSVDGLQVEGGVLNSVLVDGRSIECSGAVVASGVWSGPLAQQLGVTVPLESERGYHLEFWDANLMPTQPTMLAACKAVATPMRGRLRVAGAVEFGGTQAPASEPPFDLLEASIKRLMPGLTYSRIERWMGHRPAPADSIPIIGAAPAVDNAWLAFGHHHIGLTCGPKTGRLVAQLVTKQATSVDMTPYSPDRFRIR